MPAQVIITEPARNIVEITTTTNSVAITEQVNTVSVAASTVSGAGGGSTSGIINITNSIGDAVAGETYPQGTSLETIIRDIVAPFFEPTFATIGYSATNSQTSGNDLLVECGLSSTVSTVALVFTNPENLDTNTPVSFLDVSDQSNAFSQTVAVSTFSTPTIISLSPSYVIDTLTIPFSRTFKVTAGFLGNDGTGSVVTLEKNFNIFHRHRFYILTSELSTVGNGFGQFLSASTTDEVLSTLDVNPNIQTQSLAVQCNANTANTSKFTWIFIAGAGTLGEVAAEVTGKGVADYTDSWVADNNNGSGYSLTKGTATPVYKAYRSIQPGAFDSDITLNIEILH